MENIHEWSDKEQKSLCALDMHLQKTKLCMYHLKGRCKHSKACRFAHGPEELVDAPNLHKTRMCPSVLANKACNNPNCTFAHYEDDLKKVNICHKTVVCSWFLVGQCRNGRECSFAHGEHELKRGAKNLSQDPNFEPPPVRQNIKRLQNDCVIVPPSKEAFEPVSSQVESPAPPYMPLGNSLFHEAHPFHTPQQQLASVSVPPPPPSPQGFNDMQLYVGGQYSHHPQQEVLPIPLNYMPMQPPPAMPPVDLGICLDCDEDPISMEPSWPQDDGMEVSVTKGEKVERMGIMEPGKRMRQANKGSEQLKQKDDEVRNFASGLSPNGAHMPGSDAFLKLAIKTRPRSRSMDVPSSHGKKSDDSCFNLPGYLIKNTFINTNDYMTMDDAIAQWMTMDDAQQNSQVQSLDSSYCESTYATVGVSDPLNDSGSNGWREEVTPSTSDVGRNCWTEADDVSLDHGGYFSASGTSTPELLPHDGTPDQIQTYNPWQQPFMNFQVLSIPPPPTVTPPPLPPRSEHGMVECMGGQDQRFAPQLEANQDHTGVYPHLTDGCGWGLEDSSMMAQDPSGAHGCFTPVSNLPPQRQLEAPPPRMHDPASRPEPMTSMLWSDPVSPCPSPMQASSQNRSSARPPQVHRKGIQDRSRQAMGKGQWNKLP
jgi:hypothetical protein